MTTALTNFEKDFFRNFLDWSAPDYTYSRFVSDNRPYQMIKEDTCTKIVFHSLGVAEEDISVRVERERGKDYLVISGATRNEVLGKEFNVSGKFTLDGECVDNIEYEAKDGLLNIVVNFKTPEPSKIEIKRKGQGWLSDKKKKQIEIKETDK